MAIATLAHRRDLQGLRAVAVLLVSKAFTEQRTASQAASGPVSDAHISEGLWNRNVVCILLAVIFRSCRTKVTVTREQRVYGRL